MRPFVLCISFAMHNMGQAKSKHPTKEREVMQYRLDKSAYARWYTERFREPPDPQLMAAGATVIVELEKKSKLSSPNEKVVHVHTTKGSVGVPLEMGFVVAKRCLVPYLKDR